MWRFDRAPFWLFIVVFLFGCSGDPSVRPHDAPPAPERTLNTPAPSNLDAVTVNRWLHADTPMEDGSLCHFYSTTSPSVVHGHVHDGPRIKIVASPDELLAACEGFRKARVPCSALDVAGHSFESVGLTGIFAIKHAADQTWTWTPSSASRFDEIAHCLRALLPPDAPIIFSTCGGQHLDDGTLEYWPGKIEAQQAITDALGRPVISAVGPCSADGVAGTFCAQGWFLSEPSRDPSAKLAREPR